MGKGENNGNFGNYNLSPESWQKQTTNEGMRLTKVKVISSPPPKVIEISKLSERLVFLSYLSAYECEILFEAFMRGENKILLKKSGLHAE